MTLQESVMQAMSYRHVSAAAANLSAVEHAKFLTFMAQSLPWMSVAEIHLQSTSSKS